MSAPASGPRPTTQLLLEHAQIERALRILERLAERALDGHPPDPRHVEVLLEFIRRYVDGLHHGKEERVLFPALGGVGLPQDRGPVACMLAEHDVGRGEVEALSDSLLLLRAGSQDGLARFLWGASRYVALLREHILKEDRTIFPLAERLLPTPARLQLERDFAALEAEVGAEEVARLLRQVEALEAEVLTEAPAR